MTLALAISFILSTFSVAWADFDQCPQDALQKLIKEHRGGKPLSYDLDEYVSNFSAIDRDAWLKLRGPEHFEQMKKFSDDIAEAYAEMLEREVGKLKADYGTLGKLEGRSKSSTSILSKLLKKDFKAFKNNTPKIDDINDAMDAIGDGIGARLTFQEKMGRVDPALIEEFVNRVVIDIKNGHRIREISNYRPVGGKAPPYLNDSQIERIVQADAEYIRDFRKKFGRDPNVSMPKPITLKNGAEAEYESGYTAFHINIEYKNGFNVEFQVRGPKVHEASEIQHLFYDLQEGKPLSVANARKPDLVRAYDVFKKLSPENQKRVMEYSYARLAHGRKIEAGIISLESPLPALPRDLPQIFTFENLAPALAH